MSFTTEEKLRMELSKNACYHHKNGKSWIRSYELARRDLNRIIIRETRQVCAELEENEERFLDSEFFR